MPASKKLWTKKRLIVAGAIAGAAVIAVAIAVPVALTSKSSSSTQAATAVQTIARDETKNIDYTKDIPYGTKLSDLENQAPELPGYEKSTLVKEKTTYTENTDAGTESVVAVYSYKQTSAAENSDILELSVSVNVQKAFVEDYEMTVGTPNPLTFDPENPFDYKSQNIRIPYGRQIDESKRELFLTESGLKVGDSYSSKLPNYWDYGDGTKISAKYPIVPDKNHYGKVGKLTVNFVFKLDLSENKDSVLSLSKIEVSELTSLTPNFSEKKGYKKVSVAYNSADNFSGAQNRNVDGKNLASQKPGTLLILEQFYVPGGEPQNNLIARNSNLYSLKPYYIVENSSSPLPEEININYLTYFGTKFEFEKPDRQAGFGEWEEPKIQLTGVVQSSASNYESKYGQVGLEISKDDIQNLPAGTATTISFVATSQSNSQKKITYKINITQTILKKIHGLGFENEKEITFGGTPPALVVTTAEKTMKNRFTLVSEGRKWEIVEIKNELRNYFQHATALANEKQLAALPPLTTVLLQIRIKPTDENFSTQDSQGIVFTYKTSEAAAAQKKMIIYNQDPTELALPANRTGFKPPVLDRSFTTYKEGMPAKTKATVVYRYDSTTANADPEYLPYEVEVVEKAAGTYQQSSVQQLVIESGQQPAQLAATDLGLDEKWVLSGKEPEYSSGSKNDEAKGLDAAAISKLANQQKFIAVYEIKPDTNRYSGATDNHIVQYTVVPPRPVEIHFSKNEALTKNAENKTIWSEPIVPAVSQEWTFEQTHYAFFNEDGTPVTLSADTNARKLEIEALPGNGSVEVIWVYKNQKGEYLWIVKPYDIGAATSNYYKIKGTAKASAYPGVKLVYFAQITDLKVKTEATTLSNKNAAAKVEEIAGQKNAYLINEPAGTILSFSYTADDGTVITGEINVKPKLIYGKQTVGRSLQIKAGETKAPVPGRNVPENFGQKDNSKENANQKEYAFSTAVITEQTDPSERIYTEGRRITLADIGSLPEGTKFQITWIAKEISDDYLASVAQKLIDTYIVTAA